MVVWFITGCSSNFGRQLALVALKRSDTVIVTSTSRTKSDITDLEDKGAEGISLDLSSSDVEIQNAVREAIKPHNRVDILVNGPGEVLVGMFEETRYDRVDLPV
jgi:NAD(P)-dependent dehydrogenase (short-subunit alcohol dehydrogenase family)